MNKTYQEVSIHLDESKKKAQEKTHYGLAILILTALGSIVLKETTNKLDIQTSAGLEKCNTQLMEK